MNLNKNINYTFQSPSFFAPLTVQTNLESLSSQSTNSQWSPFSTPSFSPYQSSASVSKNFFQYSTSFASPPTSNMRQHSSSPFSFNHVNPKRTTFNERQATSTCVAANFGGGNSEIRRQQIQRFKQPKRSDEIDMSFYIKQAALQRAMGARVKVCSFCKSNDEVEIIYTSHSLKDADDNITCPVLLRLQCPICGASGEKAHTKKYCPVLQKRLRFEMLNKLAH